MKAKIYLLLSGIITSAVMTSCDKQYDDNFNTSYPDKSVGFNYAVSFPHVINVEAVPGSVQLDFGKISLSDPSGNKDNVVVKIAPAPGVITDFNTAQGTSYEQIPANAISYPTEVTIASGTREVDFKGTVNMGLLDFTKSYAVAFNIIGVSGGNNVAVNTTYKTLFVTVGLKNKYDGLWRMNGTMVDIANGALTAYPDAIIAFHTTTANSVTMVNRNTSVGAWFNVPFHPILSAGAYSVYGGWAPIFVFNASDNVTSVTNYYGNPNPANTRGSALDPTGLNVYTNTGGTKTIKVKYIMTQSSVVPAAPHHRTFFDMTFTYLGPR
jgi:hypothetical protein